MKEGAISRRGPRRQRGCGATGYYLVEHMPTVRCEKKARAGGRACLPSQKNREQHSSTFLLSSFCEIMVHAIAPSASEGLERALEGAREALSVPTAAARGEKRITSLVGQALSSAAFSVRPFAPPNEPYLPANVQHPPFERFPESTPCNYEAEFCSP